MENYEVYKKMISDYPMIEKDYLHRILQLSESQIIKHVDIAKTVESNTALTIKVCVYIQDGGHNKKELFIKTVNRNESKNSFHNMSMRESKFYKLIRHNKLVNVPIPICYDTFVLEEKGVFVIVLEDISERYKVPDSTSILDKNTWFLCAGCLAQFHAAFWNYKGIDMPDIPVKSEQEIESTAKSDHECLSKFLNCFNDKFDDKTKTVMKRAMEINNAVIREGRNRVISKNNVTIVNGDSHIYNFMLPDDKSNNPVLIDFQFWGKGIGTGDLAHLMRVDFSEDFKKNLQIPLVEHYYKSLVTHGVINYTWDDCIRDYRLRVASMVLIPLWQYSTFNMKYDEWGSSLKGLIDNYEYMNCDELYEAL